MSLLSTIRNNVCASLIGCLLSLSHADEVLGKTSVEKFFSPTGVSSVSLSPDGKHIALIQNSEPGQQLQVRNLNTGKQSNLLNLNEFTENDARIRRQVWIDNQRIAVQFTEFKKGVSDLLDTKRSSYLLVVKLPTKDKKADIIKSVRTGGWLIDPLPQEDDAFLYAKSGIYSKVYRIKPSKLSPHKKKLSKLMKKDGGQFTRKNELASVSGYANHWFLNQESRVSAVLYFSRERSLVLSKLDEKGEQVELKQWNREEVLDDEKSHTDLERKLILPIARGHDENTFYCLDFAEDDERTVYRVNFETGEQQVIYETDQYKIVDLIISEDDNKLIGVKLLKNGGIHNTYLETFPLANQEGKKRNASLYQTIASSNNKKRSLIYSEQHNQPGRYLIQERGSQKTKIVARQFPMLDDDLKTRQIERTIKVEGLDIPYILTLPEKRNESFPLIVYPHGGPIGVFDHRYFETSSQYFATNGYAVLRVNFRGSSGHSQSLEDAGKNQWGGLILKDIVSATKSVAKMNSINQNKICIFGASYGGYAATMLTLQHPDVFRCAVSVAGVSDVNLYLNSPYRTERQDIWLKKYIGDTETNYEQLKAISPLYSIHQLKRPLMIMHGMKDEVVDVEHSFRLKSMLEKHNKPFEWHIFPEGEHSLGSAEHAQSLYSRVLAFIEKNI